MGSKSVREKVGPNLWIEAARIGTAGEYYAWVERPTGTGWGVLHGTRRYSGTGAREAALDEARRWAKAWLDSELQAKKWEGKLQPKR